MRGFFCIKHLLIVMTAVVLSMIVMPSQAHAFACNGASAQGQLYDENAVCSGTDDEGDDAMQHVFRDIICYFVVILNTVIGLIYCSLQDALKPVLRALITLYVCVFGAQVLIGTAELTTKEAMVRLLKIVAVWLFATESAWGVGVAFSFFMSIALGGTSMVVSLVLPNGGQSEAAVYDTIDQFIYEAIKGPLVGQSGNLVGFFAVMPMAIPSLFVLALYWVWNTLCLLSYSLITYMLGISAIAFLIAMSPIFLSLMLFKVTHHFFESWLKYMTSYALQIIIVFAIISMWLATMQLFGGFFGQLASMVFPYQQVQAKGSTQATPSDTWGICPPSDLTTKNFGAVTVPWVECKKSGFNAFKNEADRDKVVPPDAIPKYKDFMYFVLYNLVSLLVISYAFYQLLKGAHSIARELAGPQYVPQLGGGFGLKGFNTVSNAKAKGFEQGTAQRAARSASHSSGDAVNDFRERMMDTLTRRAGGPSDGGSSGPAKPSK